MSSYYDPSLEKRGRGRPPKPLPKVEEGFLVYPDGERVRIKMERVPLGRPTKPIRRYEEGCLLNPDGTRQEIVQPIVPLGRPRKEREEVLSEQSESPQPPMEEDQVEQPPPLNSFVPIYSPITPYSAASPSPPAPENPPVPSECQPTLDENPIYQRLQTCTHVPTYWSPLDPVAPPSPRNPTGPLSPAMPQQPPDGENSQWTFYLPNYISFDETMYS